MRNLLLILIASTVFFGCKKENDGYMVISGKVLNQLNNEVVPSAELDLYYMPVDAGFWSSSYKLIETKSADNSGNFSFKFKPVRASNFIISGRKNKFFSKETDIDPSNINEGKVYEYNIYLYAESYLKMNIKSEVTPASASDVMNVRITKGFLNLYDCCYDSTYTYYGTDVNISRKCKTYAPQWIVFECNYVKNNKTKIFKDSIRTVPFDTVTYNLIY